MSIKKSVSVLLTFLILLFSCSYADAATVIDVKSQQAALQTSEKECEQKLKEVQKDISDRDSYLNLISETLGAYEQEEILLKNQLNEVNTNINSLNQSFDSIVDEIEKTYPQSANQLKTLKTAQKWDAVKLTLTALSPVLNFADEYISICEDTIAYNSVLREVNNRLVVVEDKLSDLKLLSSSVDTGETVEEVNEEISALDYDITKTDNALDTWYAAYRAQAGGIAGNIGGDSLYGTAQFIWPCPGYIYITQHYDEEDHGGIDISGSGIEDKAVVAADSGTIVYASEMDTYGNLIIIDHGNGYLTYYAHLNAYAVNVGDQVLLGQVIGYVGSTGNSTGPHLHFEVYWNGQRTDPLNYF